MRTHVLEHEVGTTRETTLWIPATVHVLVQEVGLLGETALWIPTGIHVLKCEVGLLGETALRIQTRVRVLKHKMGLLLETSLWIPWNGFNRKNDPDELVIKGLPDEWWKEDTPRRNGLNSKIDQVRSKDKPVTKRPDGWWN